MKAHLGSCPAAGEDADGRPAGFKMPSSRFLNLVIQCLPSWFTICMGTGVVSVLLHVAPHQFRGMPHIGTAFYILNVLLFLFFLTLSVIRYTLYPWIIIRMLRHPTICLFLGAMPMALCTIINGTVLIVLPVCGPWMADVVHVLWWLDVALTLGSTFGIPFVMFHIHDLALETMTAVWLMPIVPAVVAAASGGFVAGVLTPSSAMVVIVVSYMLWGIGMALSFMVMVLYLHRLSVHSLPDSEVIVTAFLPLGPCGMGAAGLLLLAQAAQKVFPVVGFAGAELAGTVVLVVSVLFSLMIWGLGLWWLLHGMLSLYVRYFRGKIRFNVGVWGLIFPQGVFMLSTVYLSQLVPSIFLSWLAMLLIASLVLQWCTIAGITLWCAVNNGLSEAPCLNTGPQDMGSTQNAPVQENQISPPV